MDVLEDLEYAIEKGNAYLLRNLLTDKDLTGARSFVAYSNVGRDSRTLLRAEVARRRAPRTPGGRTMANLLGRRPNNFDALEPLESSPLDLETYRSPDRRLAVLGGRLLAC